MGITGKKTKNIVSNILHLNNHTSKNINIDIINNNKQNWKSKNKLSFFVDFEKIGKVMLKSNKNTNMELTDDFIFMIGLGWQTPNSDKWNY